MSIMSQNNLHKSKRERVNRLTKLSLWIMLRLHLQLKLETKLVTHIELGVKW